MTGLLEGSKRSLVPVAILSLLSPGLLSLPAQAQLPPVNMGKFIHQPGDNQYSVETQQNRHGAPAPAQVMVPQQQSMPMRRVAAPRKPKADVSLDPVVCDEPVLPAGFPPMPDNLDLPGVLASSSMGSVGAGYGVNTSYGAGGGYSSKYSGAAPGMGSGAPGGGGIQVETRQHYQSCAPGSFVKLKDRSGKPPASAAPAGDYYASGDGASDLDSPAQRQLRTLGPEPKLGRAGGGAPEVPQAVQINQSTSQDLSLPDDEAPSSGGKKSQSQAGKMMKNMARRTGSRMMQQLYRMPMGF
jgi:hypothetical protein